MKVKRRIAKKIILIIFLFIAGSVFLAKTANIPFVGIDCRQYGKWSIGIYSFYDDGNTLKVYPYPKVKNPILSAKDVTDRKAHYIADPFLVNENGSFYMFFEVVSDNQGDIGVAISKDGIKWKYQKIVLDEPFHLSYPCVFKWEGIYYMIPESSQAKAVRLYRAVEFPYCWEFVKTLLEGKNFSDPTIFYFKNKWWLFVSNSSSNVLYLYYADSLEGIWIQHIKSPVVAKNKNIARPAGSIIHSKNRLLRIAQDDFPTYGNSVRAFQIVRLDTEEYEEREMEESPLLGASGKGWNRNGMHQLSVCQINEQEWIASVDGLVTKEKDFLWIELPGWIGKFARVIVK
jgi:hypothetical protein